MEKQLHLQIYGLKVENQDVRERIVCLNDCYMYVSPGEHNKLALEEPIPVGTVLECKYEYNYFTYTNYNGVNGWIIDLAMMTDNNIAKVAEKSENSIITVKNTPLYELPDENSKVLHSVSQSTELEADYEYARHQYSYNGYFRVAYNQKTGWLKENDCAILVSEEYYFDENLEFVNDFIFDGNVIAQKGENFNFSSKYASYWSHVDLYNYYFQYKGYGLFLNDLLEYVLFKPKNMTIMFLKEYEDLPVIEKVKVKAYHQTFSYGIDTYYIEYNNKMYELKCGDFLGIIFDESDENQLYSIYEAISDFELVRSPYDDTVVASVKKGDMIYCYGYGYDYGSEYGNRNHRITQNGEIGFFPKNVRGMDVHKFIDYNTKSEFENYIEVLKKQNVKFINSGDEGEYIEKLVYSLSGDYLTNKELICYSNLFGSEPQENKIPANTQIQMLGTVAIITEKDVDKLYYLVSFENQIGHVILKKGDLTLIEQENSEEQIQEPNENVNIFETQIEKRENSSFVIGVLCVGGAFILALTSFVTIKLINKKNDKE